MKSVFIHQGLEYRLEVKGDEFFQGDELPCTFTIQNHGSSPVTPTKLELKLAQGHLKKVKEKKEDAFTVIAGADLSALPEVAPGQRQSCNASFTLDRNIAITDKNQSMFLLFGAEGIPGASGQMLLTIQTHKHIQTIVSVLETFFQFVLKGQKWEDGWVKTKLVPPAAPRFSLLKELNLGCRFEGDALDLSYVYTVRQFDVHSSSSSSVGIKKGKTTIDQRLESKSYLLPGGFINHETIETLLTEALSPIMTGF